MSTPCSTPAPPLALLTRALLLLAPTEGEEQHDIRLLVSGVRGAVNVQVTLDDAAVATLTKTLRANSDLVTELARAQAEVRDLTSKAEAAAIEAMDAGASRVRTEELLNTIVDLRRELDALRPLQGRIERMKHNAKTAYNIVSPLCHELSDHVTDMEKKLTTTVSAHDRARATRKLRDTLHASLTTAESAIDDVLRG